MRLLGTRTTRLLAMLAVTGMVLAGCEAINSSPGLREASQPGPIILALVAGMAAGGAAAWLRRRRTGAVRRAIRWTAMAPLVVILAGCKIDYTPTWQFTPLPVNSTVICTFVLSLALTAMTLTQHASSNASRQHTTT